MTGAAVVPRRPIALVLIGSILGSIVGLLGALASLHGAPPASALVPGATLNVVIDELSPLVPGPGGTLRVTGRIVNASPTEMEGVRVRLRLSASPIGSRDAVEAIRLAPLDPQAADGSPLAGFDPDGYQLDSVGADVADTLAPAQEAPFSISVPMADLPLGRAGAYVVGVEALARVPGADEFEERKGIERTFLPWLPRGEDTVAPIRLLWLWPLADWPARTASGTLLDDQTPAALAPDGRLGRLVRAGQGQPVTWIADASLLQSARAIADGYQVDRDGTVVVGDESANGSSWLASLDAAIGPGTPLHLLPYADIDASASRRAGLATDVVQAVTSAPEITTQALDVPQGEMLAWSPSGRIDRQTTNVLSTSGLGVVVLRATAVRASETADGEPPTTPTGIATIGTGTGPLTALLADDALSAILDGSYRTGAQALAARQRFLAHTAVIASEPGAQPSDSPAASSREPRTIVVAPGDVRWDPAIRLVEPLLRATQRAPWLAPTSLERALDGPRVPRQRATYGEQAREAELDPGYLDDVAEQAERLDQLGAVLSDPTPIVQPFRQALLRAQSSAWRSQPMTATTLLRGIRRELTDRTDAVRVLSEGRIVFSGDVGAVPITIVNELDQSVTVGVRLVGEPTARLSSEPLEGIEIEPGRRVSVDLDARVIGGEPLDVRVQLTTPEGDAYGTPGRITVASTAYARAAAWVVIAAFVAIAVFVVVGITRRIRKARATAGTAMRDATPAKAAGDTDADDEASGPPSGTLEP